MTSAKPSTSSPGADIVIGRRGAEDHEALDRMYAEVFGEEALGSSRERWKWQYEKNPHCPPEGPEIWVAKENGEVLGQYASMPVRLKVKDAMLRASWGMDVMVKPNLQKKGVGSKLFRYWGEHVEASLGLGLSWASYMLFKKIGWEDVGPVPCFTRVLDPQALLSRRLGPLPAKILYPLASAYLGLAHPARGAFRPPRGVEVVPLEGSFGVDFDRLWEKASPPYDFIAERKSRYLEWKYHEVPYVSYEIFQAFRDKDLAGYIVLRDAEKNGVKLGLLIDWFAHPGDIAVLEALLDRAADWGREKGVARLQTFTFDERLAERLRYKGFFKIKSPMQFCVKIHGSHVDASFFRDTTRWHVTFGDSDQDRHV